MEEVLQGMCAPTKLERDRAEAKFLALCTSMGDTDVVSVRQWILETLDRGDTAWEVKYGALTTARILLPLKTGIGESLIHELAQRVICCLEDSEFRVRIAAGECLGAMCAVGGLQLFSERVEIVKAGIRANLERCEEPMTIDSLPTVDAEALRRKINAEQIFHDTAGWKSLETWMRCLHSMVENISKQEFQNYDDPEFFPLLFDALKHTNRFVRETGFQLLGASVAASRGKVQTMEVARQLASGLADNWSQVRMVASVATRNFLQCYGMITPSNSDSNVPLRMASDADEMERQEVLDLLLPPMCLNRYYVADGVRIYSLETWRLSTTGSGPALVGRHLQAIVNFYLSQCEADNHAVREAACSCLAELATKVEPALVQPLAVPIMEALLVCFIDDSWPVRDTACLASGQLFAAFPGLLASFLPTLLPLCFANLHDGVPSVRQGAAGALRNIVEAVDTDAGRQVEEEVLRRMSEGLQQVKSQKQESEAGTEGGRATFGVVEEGSRFENQVMYSCGSLAPKMKKGSAKKGGCHDGCFSRPPQPWEITDGSVHLLTSLSHIPRLHQKLLPFLPTVSEVAGLRHYPHHVYLLETIFRSLPIMARNLGKRHFKGALELFLEPLGYGVSSDNALTVTAAQTCVQELAKLVGSGIFRGRVEMFDSFLLPKLSPYIL